MDNSSYPLINIDIQLSLSTPAEATGPVPVMMELGLSPEAWAAILKRIPEDRLAAFAGKEPTWQQQVVAKGWGYAILIPATVQPDNGAGLTDGIIGLVNHGQPRSLDVTQWEAREIAYHYVRVHLGEEVRPGNIGKAESNGYGEPTWNVEIVNRESGAKTGELHIGVQTGSTHSWQPVN